MALIPISTGPSSRYQLPDMRPLTQGYTAFGAGIGRGLEKLFERRREEEAKAANKEWLGQFMGKPLKPEDLVRGVLGAPNKEAATRLLSVGSLLPAAKEAGPFTLGTGQVRYDAEGNVIAEGPAAAAKAPQGFTLGQGQVRYDAEGNVIAEGKEKPPETPSNATITLFNPTTREHITRKRDNPELPTLFRDGWIEAPFRVVAPDTEGLGKNTPGKTEEELNKEWREANERISKVDRIFQEVENNPHLLQWNHQSKMALFNVLDKVGLLGEGGAKELDKYGSFKAYTNANLNEYIKEITGAQMSEKEATRLKKAVPTLEDSPTVFMAKAKAVMSLIHERRQQIAQYVMQGGVLPTKEAIESGKVGDLNWSPIDAAAGADGEPKAEASDGAFDPDAIMGLSDEEFAARDGEISDWMLEPATVGKLSNEQFDKIMKRLGIE